MFDPIDEIIKTIYSKLENLKNILNSLDKRLSEIEEKTNQITEHIYEYHGTHIE